VVAGTGVAVLAAVGLITGPSSGGVGGTVRPVVPASGFVATPAHPDASIVMSFIAPTTVPRRGQATGTGLAAAAVAAAEQAAGRSTQLAVAVLDRATGERASGGRGDEPFYTASLSKVVVAVDVLDRRRLEGLAVTDADLELFRRALGPSDDNAMNGLWSRFDGAGAAGRVAGRLSLTGTSDPRDPSQWGEMTVSAADTTRIWQHILDEMPTVDRDLLINDMQAAPPRARDGFVQAYGLLAPEVDGGSSPGAVAKQGWMCCFSGIYYMHSTGVVGPDQRFVVTLLTRVPRSGGWEAARRELDRIAVAAVAPLA
jgi:hypothetical protein